MLKFIFAGVVALLFSAVATPVAVAQDYDLVILNGRVMDPETNYDAIVNVGIRDGRIATVTADTISGNETIDATGHVVAPGFIDMHSHINDVPFGQKLMLRMGVTTPLDLEVGAWPVEKYYDELEGRSQTNYGATVSTFGIRQSIAEPRYNSKTGNIATDVFAQDESAFVDMSFQNVPSEEHVEEIIKLARKGMEQGALGLAVPVGYAVQGVTSEEINGVQKLAGEYGVATFVHGRFSSQASPTSGILGFSEFIANVGIYGGGVMFHHAHQQALGQTGRALGIIDDARANGLSVLAEIYPYTFGATIIAADYLVPENYGPNMGRSYSDIIETATGERLDEARYNDLVKAAPGTSVMFYGATDRTLRFALAHPTTVIGSDAFPMTVIATGEMARDWDLAYEDVTGHPRSAGTYPLVLRMVREEKLMPLMLALGKMSFQVAEFLQENGVAQMAYKGRIQAGADADITIFNPETVTENSTLKAGAMPPTGIPFVIVNGTVVVRDSKVLKDVYPGRPLRLPVRN